MKSILIKMSIGGLSGLLSAVLVDLDAFRQSGVADDAKEPFDMRKALRRYLYGIVSGMSAGLGLSQVDALT